MFSAVSALIRLGHKYELDVAMAEGVRLLKTVFTTSLLDQPGVICRRSQPVFHRKQTGPTVQYECADAIAAVNLAHLTSEWSILPHVLPARCQEI